MRPIHLISTAVCFASLSSAVRADERLIEARPDLTFSIPDITLDVGDRIRFENAGGFHNVREVGSADSLAPVPGGFCAPAPGCTPSASNWATVIAFDEAGTYHYVCEVHGAAMRGMIQVVGEPTSERVFANGFEGS